MSNKVLIPFLEAVEDVSAGNPKVPASDYKAQGQFPVVDQGKTLIAGYADEARFLYRGDLPVVIFGDHTRSFKYVDFPFCMGADGVKVLRARDGIESRYLYHALSSLQIPNAGYSRHFKFLKEMELRRPSRQEQFRIVEVLDRVDALRAKRREFLAHLDELAQSIFIDMFGDSAANHPRFEVLSCGDVCTRVTVGLVVKPASYYVDSGVPALRSLNIHRGSINVDRLVYFSDRDNETKLAKSRIYANDVVVVRTGSPGTAAVVPQALHGANAIDILIATPDVRKIDPTYLCSYLNSPEARKFVLGEKRGQIQEHLNVASLKSARLPVPPLGYQQCFADRIRAVDALKVVGEAALTEVDSLVTALRYRAFRGEL